MVREGRQVQVLDAKTQEDVTAFVLTHIILEQAKSRDLPLPVPVLHMLIRYGDNVLNEFFDRHFQQWVGMGAEFREMARRTAEGFAPFDAFFAGPRGGSDEEDDKGKS